MISLGCGTRLLCLALIFAALPAAGVVSVTTGEGFGDTGEIRLWKAPVRDSRLNELGQAVTSSSCELTQPPQALTTPDPLLDGTKEGNRITVSFIIGTDGTVHSPLILESAGQPEDQHVLEAVRSWRYRPATCNGVPMEAEAKIEFSNR
jgi:TonB family protein